ncbi:hypothetical protein DSOUD_0671 [Desulfuromonas soudanensis]|uniref:Uncharacterized protein n=1 Tax=Desulfuromonas soudanensis TaxID=1603606 RepID=A0A0M3QF21_9BACT|nr:hypothetical protein DSOUD_0671 [Desulfuromonas soudanensis]
MLIKTLLNKVERFKSFVYGSICIMFVDGVEALVVDIEPRRNSRPICPEFCKRRRVYNRQPSDCSSICRSGRSSPTTTMLRAGSTARVVASR